MERAGKAEEGSVEGKAASMAARVTVAAARAVSAPKPLLLKLVPNPPLVL